MKIKKIVISLLTCFCLSSFVSVYAHNEPQNNKIAPNSNIKTEPALTVNFRFDSLNNYNELTKSFLKSIIADSLKSFMIYDCLLNYDMASVDGDGNNLKKKYEEEIANSPEKEKNLKNLAKYEQIVKSLDLIVLPHEKDEILDNSNEFKVLLDYRIFTEKLDREDLKKIVDYVKKSRDSKKVGAEYEEFIDKSLPKFIKCFIPALNRNFEANFKDGNEKYMQEIANKHKIDLQKVKETFNFFKGLNEDTKVKLAQDIYKSFYATFSGSILDAAN